MKIKKRLWNRKLDCGHWRKTGVAFMCKNYDKPKIGETCYCRECYKDTIVLKVEEVKLEKTSTKFAYKRKIK